jgi:threonine/homoserine/homoserine lactone efflux protein
MFISDFFQGIVLGFSIAAPVGPIGLLCIRRTLVYGLKVGFLSGVGAALADGIFSFIAAFGVTAVSGFLLEHRTVLQVLGSMFLLGFGFFTFRSRPNEPGNTIRGDGFGRNACLSTFFLTLTNPMTMMAFAAAFAGMGIGAARDYRQAVVVVCGVFSGSLLWWSVLSHAVNRLRTRFDENSLVWINRLSGTVIMVLGVVGLLL